FHFTPDFFINSRNTEGYGHQIFFSKLTEDVKVTQHQRIFCQYTYRMSVIQTKLKDFPCNFKFTLSGLVAVCVAGQRESFGNVIFLSEEFLQQFRCIFLHHYLSLEISSGRVAPEFMSWPGKTIGAAVLASLIWI